MSDPDERRPFPAGVGDPYGRELEEVRGEAQLAKRVVELLDEALTLGQRLTPGREAGQRMFQRLEVSRATIATIAERDTAIASELAAFLAGDLDWIAARREGTTRLALRPRRSPTKETGVAPRAIPPVKENPYASSAGCPTPPAIPVPPATNSPLRDPDPGVPELDALLPDGPGPELPEPLGLSDESSEAVLARRFDPFGPQGC